MQSAKDSFYMALRQRLAAVNAMRVINLDGQQQPAILLKENQPAVAAGLPPGCFSMSFGGAQVAPGFHRAPRPLMMLDCTIEYFTRGRAVDGADRGRTLGALDAELLQICMPPSTPKMDYTRQPAQPLASNVFWLHPELQAVEDTGGLIHRTATIRLYFIPEGGA